MAANGCREEKRSDKKEGMSGRNVAASGWSFHCHIKKSEQSLIV